jgi:hypothetical protein
LGEAGAGKFVEPASGIVSVDEPCVGPKLGGWLMTELER